jgi:hypothetical protein
MVFNLDGPLGGGRNTSTPGLKPPSAGRRGARADLLAVLRKEQRRDVRPEREHVIVRKRDGPVSSEQASIEGVLRRAVLLSPRGQTELYLMLRDYLAEVAAPPSEADETIERQQDAIAAMEQVAAALKLPDDTAPKSTQFDAQARALGLDWNVSRIGRLFKGWSNAQGFYERRQLPETARQIRQRRRLRNTGRTPLDHLAVVAEWLDTNPPETVQGAYDNWRAIYSRAKAGGEEPLPAHSNHLGRLFPELRALGSRARMRADAAMLCIHGLSWGTPMCPTLRRSPAPGRRRGCGSPWACAAVRGPGSGARARPGRVPGAPP